ncbi:crotonase/enoyl-CoA hydratase family protein [Nocardioides pantholopis]|uniref:crotonase/enoyl-CoA hydratase family protein n=1 Tax=Nocardioides pantholopis TaxID=2483798 RepID=UPI000F092335|nr:crotonase/enoyl-CoA hydratase family protein [Nocardioides pantholopis]
MTVRTETAGRTFVITIDRPAVRNAVDAVTSELLAAAFDELDARPDVTVGVLAGAHGHFCAGLDLRAFLAGQRPSIPERGFAGLVRRPPQKPLIAAVEGAALGGGFEMVLACDLVVAAQDAFFGQLEVTRGLVASGGGLMRLPRKIPRNIALEWILTGARISASRAHEVHLVNRLVPSGEALARALELAEEVGRNGPLAVRASKQIVVESQDWTDAEFFQRQAEISDPVRASADAQEGARAFVEGRRPEWTGR